MLKIVERLRFWAELIIMVGPVGPNLWLGCCSLNRWLCAKIQSLTGQQSTELFDEKYTCSSAVAVWAAADI